MADHVSRAPESVSQQLTREPAAFEFFQAVRLLEREAATCDPESGLQPVGGDAPPRQEIVRFRAVDTQRFPPAPIAALRRRAEEAGEQPIEMMITCLGLTGPAGVLPGHYSQLVTDTARERQTALRDFLDLFNHRLASLFYRAWTKYRLPIVFEAAHARQDSRRDDPFTSCLCALVGLGTSRLRDRLQFDDLLAVYLGGALAHRPRNAVALEALVTEFLRMPAEVRQFQGQWLTLDRGDQTCLASSAAPRGQYAALGVNALAGQRVWGVESKFVVRLGPLDYDDFCRFMPASDGLRAVCQLIRLYVGPEFDFAIQPVLRAAAIPASCLGDAGRVPTRLGWNSWIVSRPPAIDADAAVFVDEGRPEPTRA